MNILPLILIAVLLLCLYWLTKLPQQKPQKHKRLEPDDFFLTYWDN